MKLKRKIPFERIKVRLSNGTMFSIEDFIIAVFCCVDDLWNQITQEKKLEQEGLSLV